jgi:hypothetical protein
MHGRPESLVKQQGDFGGCDGDADVDEQRDGGEASDEANYEQNAAGNLDNTHEGRDDVRVGYADLREPAEAESLGEEKFLDAFGEKNPANEDAQQ